MDSYRYVVLGGGVAAGYAAQEMAKLGLAPGELCLVSADNRLPYERPPLSKGFLLGNEEFEDILINKPKFYQDHGVEVRLATSVTELDFAGKRMRTDSGGEIGFDKLLIVTGSRVRTLDLPGAHLANILYLRWLDDAQRIRDQMREAKRAVVIGGGFIGMEVASALTCKKVETTLVFPEDRVMAGFFTPEMSDFYQRCYESKGVRLVPGRHVGSFVGNGAVTGVTLDSAEKLLADLVVIGIGVRPAIELFHGSALQLGEGVVVNEYLESNVDGVYAAGDVAEYYDILFDKHRRIEHWDNAAEQGKHAACLLMGKREPFVKVPYFFSDVFDLSWDFWGDTENADQIVYRDKLHSGRFSVWWLREGRVVAAFLQDRPDDECKAAPEWIKAKLRVDPGLLEDETTPLAAMVN